MVWCLLFVVCCLLIVVCCLLFVGCCVSMWCVVRCLRCVVWYWLFVDCCLLFVVCCVLCVVVRSLLLCVVCCLLFVVCCYYVCVVGGLSCFVIMHALLFNTSHIGPCGAPRAVIYKSMHTLGFRASYYDGVGEPRRRVSQRRGHRVIIDEAHRGTPEDGVYSKNVAKRYGEDNVQFLFYYKATPTIGTRLKALQRGIYVGSCVEHLCGKLLRYSKQGGGDGCPSEEKGRCEGRPCV
jgi:hypothetical protein